MRRRPCRGWCSFAGARARRASTWGGIRLLAEHFVRAHAPQGQAPKFTPAALAKLQQHPWPGNIRELSNVVCQALLMRQGRPVSSRPVPF